MTDFLKDGQGINDRVTLENYFIVSSFGSRYLLYNQDIIRIKYDILCLCSFLLEPSLCPRKSDSFKNNPITNFELAVEM